jgi:lipoate-protein ligase B
MPHDTHNMNRHFYAIDLGLMRYVDAWNVQQKAHELVKTGAVGGFIFRVEHPPVITLGKNASQEYLLWDATRFAERGIDLIQSDRGGEVTAHMPGQMVNYFVLPLKELALPPKRFVHCLEDGVMDLLSHYGIKAERNEQFPGVWVGEKKICALGIRIKDRVSMHGIALNVSNDLGLFDTIVPCGISGGKACTVAQNVGHSVSSDEIWLRFKGIWAKLFNVELLPAEGLAILGA